MGEADEVLFARWRSGDSAAGDVLCESYYEVVRGFFRARSKSHADVEDLVQQTFTVCLRGGATVTGQGSFRAFLFSVARRILVDNLRRRSLRRPRGAIPLSVEWADEPSSPAPDDDEVVDAERVTQALRTLPDEQRKLLELRYWHDIGLQELADLFGVPVGTIRLRVHRARRALRAAIDAFPQATPVGRARDEVLRLVESQLGATPWVTIANALLDSMERGDVDELTLPEIERFAVHGGFEWRDVHVVVEKLAENGIGVLERQFVATTDAGTALVSPDEVAARYRAGLQDEHERAAWLVWACDVRVVWRLSQQPASSVETAP